MLIKDHSEFSNESYLLAKSYVYDYFKDPKSIRYIDEDKAKDDF